MIVVLTDNVDSRKYQMCGAMKKMSRQDDYKLINETIPELYQLLPKPPMLHIYCDYILSDYSVI